LAMSSRNVRLSEAERGDAVALHRALITAEDAVRSGNRDPGAVARDAIAEIDPKKVELEYFELVSADTLAPVSVIGAEVLAVIAAGNAARFETYTIAGTPGSGEMKVNGAAARLVHKGDTIIVISYASYDPDDLEHYDPRVVHVAAGNEIINIDNEVATLLG